MRTSYLNREEGYEITIWNCGLEIVPTLEAGWLTKERLATSWLEFQHSLVSTSWCKNENGVWQRVQPSSLRDVASGSSGLKSPSTVHRIHSPIKTLGEWFVFVFTRWRRLAQLPFGNTITSSGTVETPANMKRFNWSGIKTIWKFISTICLNWTPV
jgi:hypothetical protein